MLLCFFILAQSLAMLLFHDKWFVPLSDADFYVVAYIKIIRLHIRVVMVSRVQRRLDRSQMLPTIHQCMSSSQ
jgi:hypothetical protein